MKDWRPQVILGMAILGALGGYAMYLGFENMALASVAGIVYSVKTLSDSGKLPKQGA